MNQQSDQSRKSAWLPTQPGGMMRAGGSSASSRVGPSEHPDAQEQPFIWGERGRVEGMLPPSRTTPLTSQEGLERGPTDAQWEGEEALVSEEWVALARALELPTEPRGSLSRATGFGIKFRIGATMLLAVFIASGVGVFLPAGARTPERLPIIYLLIVVATVVVLTSVIFPLLAPFRDTSRELQVTGGESEDLQSLLENFVKIYHLNSQMLGNVAGGLDRQRQDLDRQAEYLMSGLGSVYEDIEKAGRQVTAMVDVPGKQEVLAILARAYQQTTILNEQSLQMQARTRNAEAERRLKNALAYGEQTNQQLETILARIRDLVYRINQIQKRITKILQS